MVHSSWNDYPILLVELDLSKNKGLTLYGKNIEATNLAAGTNMKLDWTCSKCSHEWAAQGSKRVRGAGCPACSNKAIHIDGRNSMAQTHPKLAMEFQGDASKVIAGTNKKLDWRCCVCDHVWSTTGDSRVRGSGCPACSGSSVHFDSKNSMANTHPRLAEEFLGDPTKVLAGTKEKLAWRCSTCAHEWKTTGGSRIRGSGCPACVNQAIHIHGKNSMAQTHPKLAQELQGDATKIIAGTSKRLDWKCLVCDNEWRATGNSRVSNNSGCPFCNNGQLHSDGRNSMANTHPQLSKEFKGNPTEVIATTHKKLDWKCLICGNEWTVSGKNRVEKESSCPFCYANHLHSDGRNSMAVTHPELAREFLGDASTIIASTNSKLRWECQTCTHIWEATGNHRVFSQSGCPACTNQVVHMDGRNSLAAMYPKIALECKQDAKNIVFGSSMKCDWECQNCFHIWQAKASSRTQRGHGCPACANNVLHVDGLNSMYFTHPELAEEYQGDSMKVLAGTAQNLLWVCKKCSFSWKATGHSRTKGTGCPSCSKGGYDPSKTGVIYIMEYSDSIQRWLKVGISNDPEKRLKDLRRSAAEYSIDVRFLDIFEFEDGNKPPLIEKFLLSQNDIRFEVGYDIDGRSEFFNYDALTKLKQHVENRL